MGAVTTSRPMLLKTIFFILALSRGPFRHFLLIITPHFRNLSTTEAACLFVYCGPLEGYPQVISHTLLNNSQSHETACPMAKALYARKDKCRRCPSPPCCQSDRFLAYSKCPLNTSCYYQDFHEILSAVTTATLPLCTSGGKKKHSE